MAAKQNLADKAKVVFSELSLPINTVRVSQGSLVQSESLNAFFGESR